MKRAINIGIIGDFDPAKASHPATNDAIHHAAKGLSIEANISWLPTTSFLNKKEQPNLTIFDCLWASSGSPYLSIEGMINAIQTVREMDRPFIGT